MTTSAQVTLESLASDRIWVAWQSEDRDGAKEPTKVPYSPRGRKAKAGVPSTWGTRAEVEAFLPTLPRPYGQGGIGIEFSRYSNARSLGGVDLDTCRDPQTGIIEPWAVEIIEKLDTYTEVSPSGTGVKLFFTYPTSDLPTLRTAMGGAKFGKQFKRGGGKHPPSIELHLGNRYFTVTEQHYDGTPIEFRHVPTEDLIWLLKEAGPNFAGAGSDKKNNSKNDNSRSAKAFRKAISFRKEGKTFDDLCQALRDDTETADWYSEKGQANDQRELRRLWENATAAPELAQEGITEDDIAATLASKFKDRLRYCHDTGAWYEWDGNLWRRDETQAAFHLCRQVCRDARQGIDNPKITAILGKASTSGAVERFARADRAFAVTAATWDQDHFLLGTPAGTVDLRTGRLRSSLITDFITKQTAVAPSENQDCPLWLQFLRDATRGDSAFIRFLQQWFGYCLTGDIREHALLFIFGPGGNGKSVLLNTVTAIMGDYAAVAAMDTFTASQNDRHPTDLAMLRGARLVCVSETEEGRAWAESRIKSLTGGDPISARFMRQDFFTYQPQFKITVIGNHKPVLRNVDEANRRRFNLGPFIHIPTNPDKELDRKLKAEYPAILRWMIDGCLDWQANGLTHPPVVTAATAAYFADQDTVRQWVEDCCDTTANPPHFSDTVKSLYASWKNYALDRGEDAGGSKTFNIRLQNLGFMPIKDTDGIRGRGYKGIRVHINQP